MEETKNYYEYTLQKAYIQMIAGCKRKLCLNPYCHSNPSFPNLSSEECKEYILYLASTTQSKTLSKSSNFIFCPEFNKAGSKSACMDSSHSFLVFFSNLENVGMLFLGGIPTISDPMINWEEHTSFTGQLSKCLSQGLLKEDLFVSIINEFELTNYHKLYLPRASILLISIIGHLKFHMLTISALCSLIASNKWMNEQLSNWFDSFESSQIEPIVNKLQESLSHKFLNLDPTKGFEDMLSLLKVLDLVWQSNNRRQRLSYKLFYNPVINKNISIQKEYRKWKQTYEEKKKLHPNQKFSFVDYPWIIDCGNKIKLLQQENYDLIEKELSQYLVISILSGGFVSPYLDLEVNRDSLVEDTLQQIDMKGINLKKPLKIKFIGEEGVDEGGVKKEFFQIIVKKFFESDYEMFVYKEAQRVYWFNPVCKESQYYELLGILLGLAIYNGVNLDVRFPMALYKKIQNIRTSFSDLKEFDIYTVQSLEKLLELNDTQFLCLDFILEFESFNKKFQFELIEDGKNIPVTNLNKQSFADMYVNWWLNIGVHDQFQSFKKGFLKICGGGILKLLQPEELELILCGNSVFDLKDLEKVTIYENGFTKDSNTVICIQICILWSILHSFTLEQQKKFLFFVTGSDRVPVSGLSSINFVISRNGPDSDRLMTAHTCYNYLLLPEYTSEEKMRKFLLIAISNSEGFGLR